MNPWGLFELNCIWLILILSVLSHRPEVSCGSSLQICLFWLGSLTCLGVSWVLVDQIRPQMKGL